MTKKYSGIIFDLDGTLYNMKKLALRLTLKNPAGIRYLRASRKALHELGGCFFSSGSDFYTEYYRLFADYAGCTPASAEHWENEIFYRNFISILTSYRPRPGANQLLEGLSIPSVVLSDYDRIEERLDALGIPLRFFDSFLYSGSLGGLKPAPEVFKKASKIMGIPPEQILVAGDREDKDGKGARGADMDFFLVTDESWPGLAAAINGDK